MVDSEKHMELLIKNMVCRHCIKAVRQIFEKFDIEPESVSLGRVSIPAQHLEPSLLESLDKALHEAGFSRITDPDGGIVEQVKQAVMHHVRSEEECRLNLSDCIERQLGISYDAASRIFSRHEGRTVENYCTAQRIERVKELLEYGELTLSEIAWHTGFSSPAHLSRRFKEITGITPSAYRMKHQGARRPLPDV